MCTDHEIFPFLQIVRRLLTGKRQSRNHRLPYTNGLKVPVHIFFFVVL